MQKSTTDNVDLPCIDPIAVGIYLDNIFVENTNREGTIDRGYAHALAIFLNYLCFIYFKSLETCVLNYNKTRLILWFLEPI